MCKGLIYLNNRFQNIHDHVNDTVWKRTLVPPQLPTTAIHWQRTPTSIHPSNYPAAPSSQHCREQRQSIVVIRTLFGKLTAVAAKTRTCKFQLMRKSKTIISFQFPQQRKSYMCMFLEREQLQTFRYLHGKPSSSQRDNL